MPLSSYPPAPSPPKSSHLNNLTTSKNPVLSKKLPSFIHISPLNVSTALCAPHHGLSRNISDESRPGVETREFFSEHEAGERVEGMGAVSAGAVVVHIELDIVALVAEEDVLVEVGDSFGKGIGTIGGEAFGHWRC
jgi:hypothetical protein